MRKYALLCVIGFSQLCTSLQAQTLIEINERSFIDVKKSVHSVALSSDDAMLAVSCADDHIEIRDLKAQSIKTAFKGRASNLVRMQFINNDRELAFTLLSTENDNREAQVHIWNIGTGRLKDL